MKKLLFYFAIFIILIFLYISTLTITALIPSSMIKDNIKKSVGRIFYIDRFTDAVMLDIAYRIDSTKPLESVIKANVSSIEEGIDSFDGYSPLSALANEFSTIHDEKYDYSFDYARFWHGYLIFLRPILIILDYYPIIILESILLIILLIIFEIELYKKTNKYIALAFLLSLISIGYIFIGLNIAMFFTMVIAMIFSIILLKRANSIKDIYLFFIIDGSVTCFFNYMTFTPITLGIPLIVYYLIQDNYSIKHFVKIIFAYLISYALTWVSKWIISDLLFGTNIINDSINQMVFRTSLFVPEHDFQINPLVSVSINMIQMGIPLMMESIYLLIMLAKSHCSTKSFFKGLKTKKNLIFILIGLIPFAVYLITVNHSVIHAGSYSFRLLALTEISAFIVMYNILEKNKKDS